MATHGPGLIERLMGEVALRAVALGQRLALRRGDVHEAQHFTAMVLYGNSDHGNSRCMLPETFWGDGEELAAASKAQRARQTADECQGADFSRPVAQLAQGLEDHIARDGLTGVRAAVFRDRGGHAPGEECPSASAPGPVHSMSCQFLYDDDECCCGAEDGAATRKAER